MSASCFWKAFLLRSVLRFSINRKTKAQQLNKHPLTIKETAMRCIGNLKGSYYRESHRSRKILPPDDRDGAARRYAVAGVIASASNGSACRLHPQWPTSAAARRYLPDQDRTGWPGPLAERRQSGSQGELWFADIFSGGHQIVQRRDIDVTRGLRGLSFNFAHRLLQRQLLARDFGFGEGRTDGAQLSELRNACALVNRPPAVARRRRIEALNSSSDQRIIVGHYATPGSLQVLAVNRSCGKPWPHSARILASLQASKLAP